MKTFILAILIGISLLLGAVNNPGISEKIPGINILGTFAPPPSSSETPSTTGWTDDGSIVRLSTDADNLGVGTRTPLSGYKVHIVGDIFTSGDLTIGGGSFIFGTGSASTTLTSLNGFLGIGTTSPTQTLSVHGGALFVGTTTGGTFIATSTIRVTGTSATSSWASGLNITGGCFSINGVCIAASASLTIGGAVSGGVGTSALYVNSSNNLAQTPTTSVGGMNASSTAMVAGSNGNFYLIPLMTEIASSTLSSAATSIDLQNIPQRNFIRIEIATGYPSGNTSYILRFNNDATANYDYVIDEQGAQTITNEASSSAVAIGLNGKAHNDQTSLYFSLNIDNSATFGKQISGTGVGMKTGNGSFYKFVVGGFWRNTTAQINQITLNAASGATIPAGAKITVYGSSK